MLRANLLADAIENMAKIVVEKVGQVASQFEQLYYQSSRVGASAQAIRAFEYAVSQLGGTAEGANSSLESFGRFLRNTPGALSWVAGQLHVQTKDIRGAARENTEILLDIGERLSHMPPYLADRYRQMLGIDEKTLFAIEHAPEAIRRYQESLKSQSGAGITGEAMRQATQFEQAWREVWQRIGNMAEGGELKLLTALTEPMEKFGQWLDKNSPQINSAIDKMASSVSSLTTAWVEDLNKVQWTDVANSIEGAAKSIANLTDAIVKDLPAIQALLGALVGAKIGGLFGPIGAAVGAGAGALAPSMIEQERSGPHSVDTGIRGWWRSHAPSWLGGGSAGPISQNGAPVSESNPLAVNVVKADAGAGGGASGGGLSGWWSSHMPSWLGGGGGGGGAPGSIRARAAGGALQGNELDLAKQGYAYWRSQGLSHDQALAILGNERGENGLGSLRVGDNGSAFGQAQWHMDRVADILRNTGIDVRTAGFLDQQKAMRWEMEHGAGGGHVWDKIKNAKSRSDAVWWMVNGFERPLDRGGAAATRLGFADRYGRAITDTPVPPPHPAAPAVPLAWSQGHNWDALNAALPVGGPVSNDNSSKNVNVTTQNTFNISGSGDPQTTAGMIGLHMDRSANTISRNLQGAFQ